MSTYNIILILFHLLILSKSEEWWDEVNRYNIEDDDYGYAGASYTRIIDFYLCGKRKYQVHYLGDEPSKWSENFSNCEPVGDGRDIDGICIHDEKKLSYRGRLLRTSAWLEIIKGCNLNEKHGFAGNLGTPLSCVAINGKDWYRVAYATDIQTIISSNPKQVSDRIIKNIFGVNVKYSPLDEEENKFVLSLDNNYNNLLNVTIKFLNNEEVSINGNEIKLIISENNIINGFWGCEINKLLNKKLKDILNIDINEKKKIFEKMVAEETIHGIITIHSFWKEKKITFESGIRTTEDVAGIRGGYSLNFIINDSEIFIEKIKKIIEQISLYISSENRKKILTRLKTFDNIRDIDDIKDFIIPYDVVLTQIIFLYIIKNGI